MKVMSETEVLVVIHLTTHLIEFQNLLKLSIGEHVLKHCKVKFWLSMNSWCYKWEKIKESTISKIKSNFCWLKILISLMRTKISLNCSNKKMKTFVFWNKSLIINTQTPILPRLKKRKFLITLTLKTKNINFKSINW